MLTKATEAALINMRHSNCECFGLCQQYEKTQTCASCCHGMNNIEIVQEEAHYSKKNKYPVFIVLMHTGTPLAHAIKAVTKDEYSHAGISFDPSLKPLYSFGLEYIDGKGRMGMTLNSYDSGDYDKWQSYYGVYVMYVDKETYDKMQETLNKFMEHYKEWKFDIFNLISCQLQRSSEHSKKYFCSRFVAEIINAGRKLDKLPSLHKPQDLAGLDDITLVNHGLNFIEYDPEITKRNLELVKQRKFDAIAFEAAVWTKENSYPIFFIMLSYKTPMMAAIKMITKAEFSHVCISFNPSLIPMYSFGLKDEPGHKMGLTDMNPTSDFIKKGKAYYSVYVTFVNKQMYLKMNEALEKFKAREKEMRYGFYRLPFVFLQKKTHHDTKHFCSEFCAEILSAGKEIDKDPSLYLPEDFCNMDDATLVNHGLDFSKYDPSVTERNMELIKEKRYAQIDFDYANESSAKDKYFFSQNGSSILIEGTWYYRNYKGEIDSYVKCDKSDKLLRGRSEIIIVNDEEEILVNLRKGFEKKREYDFPGGGWNEGEDHMATAIREAQEEVHQNVKDVEYFGSYVNRRKKIPHWMRENYPKDKWWYGHYNELYVGRWNGNYTGYVKPEDEETHFDTLGWVKISNIYHDLHPVHQQALQKYLRKNGMLPEEITGGVNESWFGNNIISFSKNFNHVKSIVKTLTDEELHLICNGTFKKSPYVIYRNVILTDKDPAAFIELYTLPDMEKNTAVICIACKPEYRRQGFTGILVDEAIRWAKENNITYLDWKVRKEGNEPSEKLAEKLGFQSKGDHQYFMDFSEVQVAKEGFLDLFTGKSKQEELDTWHHKIFGEKNLVGGIANYGYTGVKIKDGYIEIWGINYKLLKSRISRHYKDKSLGNIFLPKYNALSYKRFEKKRIQRADIKIDYMYTPEFFALELVRLFTDLGKRFRDKTYKAFAVTIYENSWLAEADRNAQITAPLNTSKLKNLTLTLNDYQIDFIQNYPRLKAQLNLKGYILAFEQGLGKTLTAIGLTECLSADHVYIVCPNSLKANWALEIQKYYEKYQDEDLWKQEVFICSDRPTKFNENTTKFIITNNESIEKMFPYVMSGKNILIVDESHNFRNIESKRVHQLIELRDKLKCKDTLVMSGTPIKATPNEIVPALLMIDPTFTMEAAKIFDKAFKLKTSLGTSLVQARFGKIMYRKEKDVLDGTLPEKHILPLELSTLDKDKYTLSNVFKEVSEKFSYYYDLHLSEMMELRKPFYDMSRKYAPDDMNADQFIDLMDIMVRKHENLHEIDQIYVEKYMKAVLKKIQKKEDKDYYNFLIKNYVRYKAHWLGIAYGEIMPPYRRDMYISLYSENKDVFYKMITENTKKTLIFSQFKGVVEHIYKDLNDNGIGTVMITGDVKNRLEILKEFKENNNIMVLVATSQTLGTGVTLVEANQMFFFGPPWRNADFEQCSDRIHRIGQTDDCYIYIVSLNTNGESNLSTRMDQILSWSKDMTDAVITKTELTEDETINNFKTLLKAQESALIDEFLQEPEPSQIIIRDQIPKSKLSEYISHQVYFQYESSTVLQTIPEDTIIEKISAWYPIDSDGKFENLKMSKIGSSVFANPTKKGEPGNVRFEYSYDNRTGEETWALISTRTIKPKEILKYNPTDDMPSFADDSRL